MSEQTRETTTKRYERLAEAFYRETGMMAPGKDQPAEMGGPDFETRTEAWREWNNARGVAAMRSTESRTRTPEQDDVARLNRVLEMHLRDERLLSWVGTSRARMAAVVEAFGEGRVSLRRAVELVETRKPEIPAPNFSASPAAALDEDEADEPDGVGAGAPWDGETATGVTTDAR